MPVGFKNTTASNVQVAVDAIVSAKNPHSFLGVTFQGLSAIVQTTGNEYCHVILRGGASGTNYDNASMESVSQILDEATVRNKIMVDCSHGNSKKLHTNQPIVAAAVGEQIASGVDRIFGVMIESNIKAGNQKLSGALEYGRSITDACIDWDTTVTVLKRLAKDVQTRRAINKHKEDC